MGWGSQRHQHHGDAGFKRNPLDRRGFCALARRAGFYDRRSRVEWIAGVQYSYDPYGNFSASGTPPAGYGSVYAMAGMENDPSGLYHANARYYSPALTRFLSEDPERGKANMFTYAGENAITGSDISGMDDCGDDCDGDGGGGGAGVGNPAAGFIQDIVSILNWIFNSNEQSSAA
ncbi:MAG: RHS repeat-associated core domain-containing protein, partial [Candidatus Binataceae bacterium]